MDLSASATASASASQAQQGGYASAPLQPSDVMHTDVFSLGDDPHGDNEPSAPQSPESSIGHPTALGSKYASGTSSARHSPRHFEDDADVASSSQLRGTPPIAKKQSHHSVPRGYRGPIPLEGDAEDIAPKPTLIHVHGLSDDIHNVLNYPINRNGWRYTAAGPASQRLPFGIYRTLETEPRGVHWSWSDRSQYTQISSDASTVSTDGGFRSARGNIPARTGAWYAEVHILPPEATTSKSCSDSAHVRVGWARREAPLNAPVGCNGYSYGIRDTTGDKVFLARTYPYAEPFGVGDVVGMWITLPEERQPNIADRYDTARIQRKRLPIRYRGRLYFESLEYAATKEMDHLMDRSRRGEKLPLRPVSNETTINASTGLIAPAKVSNANDARKKGKAPGAMSNDTPNKASSNYRSLPTLGPESKIGFTVNGKAHGAAFENLLDYRPLPRVRELAGKKSKKSSAGAVLKGFDEADADVITSSSTAASILKSRENHYDDGALGYFPFVSLYGGAKAKLVTRAADFRYPPPASFSISSEEMSVDDQAGNPSSHLSFRPLDERFDEYMEEMLHHDIADEDMWRAIILKRQAEEDEDEDERDSSPARVTSTKKGANKRKAGGMAFAKQRAGSTPVHDEKSPVTGSRMGSNTPAPSVRPSMYPDASASTSSASTPAPHVDAEHATRDIDHAGGDGGAHVHESEAGIQQTPAESPDGQNGVGETAMEIDSLLQ